MRKQILILSRPDDEHVERLTSELDMQGHLWVCFDPGKFPSIIELIAHLEEASNSTQLILPDGKQLMLDSISSVWYRRPTPIRADSDVPELQRTFIEREARVGLWGLLRAIEGRWVNHPDAIREASYKPRQLAMAQRLGLSVPRTLITNQPEALERFYETCQGKVIYKLLGFPLYEVEGEAAASTYTSLVPEDMLREAYRVKATAHLFQEYQRKLCDLRVVVIGDLLFAIEIYPLSEETRIDFRRDYRSLHYAVHTMPKKIEQALLTLTRQYRLLYAAIDLLYTPEHQYVFLEINSIGQLGWLEEPTGLPLFRTLAQFLAS